MGHDHKPNGPAVVRTNPHPAKMPIRMDIKENATAKDGKKLRLRWSCGLYPASITALSSSWTEAGPEV